MASLITYIYFTSIVVMAVSAGILKNPAKMHSNKGHCLCRKLNDMLQSNYLNSRIRHETKKNNLRALLLLGCKNATNHLSASTPLIENRGGRAALLDILDTVNIHVQTEPIYVPSVLFPKIPRRSAIFRRWKKLRFFGKKL